MPWPLFGFTFRQAKQAHQQMLANLKAVLESSVAA